MYLAGIAVCKGPFWVVRRRIFSGVCVCARTEDASARSVMKSARSTFEETWLKGLGTKRDRHVHGNLRDRHVQYMEQSDKRHFQG